MFLISQQNNINTWNLIRCVYHHFRGGKLMICATPVLAGFLHRAILISWVCVDIKGSGRRRYTHSCWTHSPHIPYADPAIVISAFGILSAYHNRIPRDTKQTSNRPNMEGSLTLFVNTNWPLIALLSLQLFLISLTLRQDKVLLSVR